MLNVYEGALKLSKGKLYKSPYKESIDEVWEVLKNFKLRCQLIFLNNLRTLKIEECSEEKLQEVSVLAKAFYKVDENKIYLSNKEKEQTSELTNHELFHVASSKKNNYSGVMNDQIGENLTEGITEYLKLKSKNKKISLSSYQRELFVIEFLVRIYGEKILEPYFMNNGKQFFQQFANFKDDIIEIDRLLEKSFDNDTIEDCRLTYLRITDIAPSILPDAPEILNNLKLNKKTNILIKFLFSKHDEQLKKEVIDNKENYNLLTKNYIYKEPTKQILHQKFVMEHQQTQIDIFKEILNKLILIAQFQGLTPDDINIFLEESLFYKNEEFKNLYTNIISEKLELQNKKR